MSEVYAACVDQLLINLARHFQFIKDGAPIPGSWDYTVRKLAEMDAVTRESEQIILSMLGDADESLRGLLEEAIRNGLKDAEPALKKAAEKGLTSGVDVPNIAPRQMQAFQYYYEQSADKLNLVNTVMLESTEQAYAATVADISAKISNTQGILNTSTGQIITGTASFNKVQRDAVRRMVDNGITGYIDHGGHHWSPEAYVAMDMRTTMTNTAREAVWEQSDSVGCDLYQVSWHDGARPLCYPWQGKVISRNGWTGEVEDGEGNTVTVHSESEIESFRYGGGLFGVNCGHYPIPFFPGFSRMRPPQQNEEENAKEYAESQQQRALERKVREEKRELEVMKAQGATKEELDAQKIRVRNANANLTEFCDKTGRARQPGRTSAPINATFPDGYQQTRYGAKKAPKAPSTVEEYNTEIQRLRDKRQALFDSDSYDKAETDRMMTDIFKLEDERNALVQKLEKESIDASVTAVRPANEQEILKQFKRFDVSKRTDAQMLAQANPNYKEGTKAWTYNCQRTVTAEELIYRGYDVTAMPYKASDPIGDKLLHAWKCPADRTKDPWYAAISERNKLSDEVAAAMQSYGEGSRAVLRVKWNKANGGNGHFLYVRNVGGEIIYSDPQSNTIIDIAEKVKNMTTSKNREQLWLMRLDNREVSENIVYAVKNRGD